MHSRSRTLPFLCIAAITGLVHCARGDSGFVDTGNPRTDGGNGGDVSNHDGVSTDTGFGFDVGGQDVVMPRDNGPRTDNGPGCSSPMVMCGSLCTSTDTDPSNCGSCGTVCDPTQACIAGACSGVATCTAPRMMCGSNCVDTATDTANCGSCSNACASGQSCSNGTCMGTTGCSPPMMMCGAVCTGTDSDPYNCGSCGNTCAVSQTCTAGVCRGPACAAPMMMCGTACVNTLSDNANCGSCNRACSATRQCVNGVCSATTGCNPPCGPGQTCSGGVCTGGTTGSPGSPCMAGADCGTTMNAGCYTPSAVWPMGYCTTLNCMTGADCGANGTCVNFGTATAPQTQCMQSCATPGSQAGCRSGYTCVGLAPPTTTGICFPACTNDPTLVCGPNHCNASTLACDNCTTAAQCQGGSTANTCTMGNCSCRSNAACAPHRCDLTPSSPTYHSCIM